MGARRRAARALTLGLVIAPLAALCVAGCAEIDVCRQTTEEACKDHDCRWLHSNRGVDACFSGDELDCRENECDEGEACLNFYFYPGCEELGGECGYFHCWDESDL